MENPTIVGDLEAIRKRRPEEAATPCCSLEGRQDKSPSVSGVQTSGSDCAWGPVPALDSRLLALDLLRRLDHRPAHVVSAIRTDDVRHHHRATLGTGVELLGLQRVVRTTLAGSGVGMLTLGKGHGWNLPEGAFGCRRTNQATVVPFGVSRRKRGVCPTALVRIGSASRGQSPLVSGILTARKFTPIADFDYARGSGGHLPQR